MRLTQIYRFPERFLSTVQRGTAFEHRALALLNKHMSMSLGHVGGSYDGGVDLLGWWWVPRANHTTQTMTDSTIASRRRLRVLAQCKAEKRKMGPAYLRELEGVVYRYRYTAASAHHPSESESDSPHIPQSIPANDEAAAAAAAAAKEPPPIALLVSESAFTRNCLHAAYASPHPFLLVHLPRNSSTCGGVTGGAGSGSGGSGSGSAIGTIFGNPALLSSKGVLGGEIEIRWERGVLGSAGHPRLWWRGQPLPNWTPDAGVVEVDGDGVLLNQR